MKTGTRKEIKSTPYHKVVLNSTYCFRGIYDQTVAVYDSEVDGFVSVFLPIEGIATLVYP